MLKKRHIAQNFVLRDVGQYMPERVLGRTGLKVRAFGLGGQSLLEQENSQKEAYDLINKAMDLGVNYLDTAAIYGPSRYYYGRSIKGRKGYIINSKVRERSYNAAKKELDDTFRLLQLPYIDIIQLHSIEGEQDKRALKRDGALQVLKDAQSAGKIGYIGLSGHADPQILMDFMDEYPFDTILIALNPAIPQFDKAVEKARSLDMGVIAMKIMSRGILPKCFSPKELLWYAMDRADVAIAGCSSESDVERNVLAAAQYEYGCYDFKLNKDIIDKSTYFLKNKSGKWPSTYQPDWPKIQYD